jgi:hypothetical protein
LIYGLRSISLKVSISTFKEFDYDLWMYRVLPTANEVPVTIQDDKMEPNKAKKKTKSKDSTNADGLASTQFDVLMNFLKSMDSSINVRKRVHLQMFCI